MQNYKVSIIIPVYKTPEKLLRSSIESVLKSTDEKIELILVDDGTPDNGGVICDEYSNKFHNIDVLHQQNQGVSVARNYGIEKSRSEYICFVDADDVVNIDGVICAVEFMKQTGDDIVLLKWRRDVLFEKIPEKITPYMDINKVDKNTLIFSVAAQVEPFDGFCVGSPWGKVFKKEFLENNNLRFLKQLRKMQDRVFMMYCLEKSPQMSLLPIDGYCYVKNDESIVNKYNPLIGDYLLNVANEIKKFNSKFNSFSVTQLNTIICKLLMEYLGIVILHPNNPSGLKEKSDMLKIYCNVSPFKESLRPIDYSCFNQRDKVKLFLLNLRAYRLIIQISERMR